MRKYGITYGIGIALALIAYFMLTKVLGLHKFPILSAMNGVIYGAGILLAMKKYKLSAETFKYEEGFQVGFSCGAIATIIFVAFMSFYMFQLDREFANSILDSWGLNYNKGALMVAVTLAMMGFSTSLVLTLAFMQLLKVSWNTSKD